MISILSHFPSSSAHSSSPSSSLSSLHPSPPRPMWNGIGSRRLPSSPLRSVTSAGRNSGVHVVIPNTENNSIGGTSTPPESHSPELSGPGSGPGSGAGTPISGEDDSSLPTSRETMPRTFSGTFLSSPASLKRNSAFSRQIELEGSLFSVDVIKLNSKGMPQSRTLTLTKSHVYLSTPKKKKCKRIISLTSVQGVSLTALWDSLVCVHVTDSIDMLIVCQEKQELVNSLVAAFGVLTAKTLVPKVVDCFEFEPRAGILHKLCFELPDGTERRSARIFVDWQDSQGNSINPSRFAAMSSACSPDCTPTSSPPTSPRLTASSSRELMLVGDGRDDGDSEDEISERKVRVRGSTLLSKMMNVIPVNDKKQANLLERLTDPTDSYVFYKWLLDPEETNFTGLKVREWQIQGGRGYMEDVLSIEYNLKNELGELYVSLFDGHGGRGAADWLGTRLQAVIEKEYAKQESKDMRACFTSAFLKANKKLLKDKEKTIGASGSTALVVIVRNKKIHIANCGDTRAVLYKAHSHTRLTVDHRVKEPTEYARLKELNAVIRKDRIYCDRWDINLARSLGDRQFQPFVTPQPDYMQIQIESDDQFLVLATDGVWDTVKEEDVGRTVRQSSDPKRICSLASALGSRDNLSAVVIFLNEFA